MAVNKVVMNTENGEKVLMDLTADTVTADTLAEGATAHDASGNKITGRMAAGSGGLPVQADWAQTDSTAPDFIKNKPFGEGTGDSDTLTISKTPEELEAIIESGQMVADSLFKVSDKVVTMSDLANGFTIVAGEEVIDTPAEAVGEAAIEAAEGITIICDIFFSVDERAVGVDSIGIVFPEKGLYMLYYPLSNLPSLSLTIPGFSFGDIEKIDAKYLPSATVLYANFLSDYLTHTKGSTDESDRVTKDELVACVKSSAGFIIEMGANGDAAWFMPMCVSIYTDKPYAEVNVYMPITVNGVQSMSRANYYTAEYTPE